MRLDRDALVRRRLDDERAQGRIGRRGVAVGDGGRRGRVPGRTEGREQAGEPPADAFQGQVFGVGHTPLLTSDTADIRRNGLWVLWRLAHSMTSEDGLLRRDLDASAALGFPERVVVLLG